MITASTIGAWLASPVVGFLLKVLIDWLSAKRAQDMAETSAKNVGRLEVTNEVNAQTLEIKNAMDNVSRPSDDDVSRSLQSGKF